MFTAEEWAASRQQPGESYEDWKRRDQRERYARRMAKNPVPRRAQTRAWREANIEAERERLKAWATANPERMRERQKRHYHRHKEKRQKLARDWIAKNPEQRRAQMKAWLEANPGLNAHYSAKWRKAARQATPLWANLDAIRAIYEEAARLTSESGEPFHVDHFYPLQGKTVCGLHVEANLQILPGPENVRKGNRHPDEKR